MSFFVANRAGLWVSQHDIFQRSVVTFDILGSESSPAVHCGGADTPGGTVVPGEPLYLVYLVPVLYLVSQAVYLADQVRGPATLSNLPAQVVRNPSPTSLNTCMWRQTWRTGCGRAPGSCELSPPPLRPAGPLLPDQPSAQAWTAA